jgi:hypothetical protein
MVKDTLINCELVTVLWETGTKESMMTDREVSQVSERRKIQPRPDQTGRVRTAKNRIISDRLFNRTFIHSARILQVLLCKVEYDASVAKIVQLHYTEAV